MAKLVAVCRDEEFSFGRRQIPLSIEDSLTMVMEVPEMTDLIETESLSEAQVEQFAKRYILLSEAELSSSMMITQKALFALLAVTVPCVGCRRSVERLYNQLWESGQAAIEPLIITTAGILTLAEGYVGDARRTFTLFSLHGTRLQELADAQPKSRRNRRCALHSLDAHKHTKSSGNWMDVWELLSQECRDEVVLIDSDGLLDTLENYLRKHRFCSECKSKVLRAYSILSGDVDGDAEKGYCAALYEGLKSCPKERHVHVVCDTDFIAHLIGRAEPELAGGRRERHARTIDIAQEEVLTCLGVHLWERLHKLWQKLRSEEQTWQMLFYLGIEALRKGFNTAFEEKQGVSQLELVVAEISHAELAERQKKENKRMKKKRRKDKLKEEKEQEEERKKENAVHTALAIEIPEEEGSSTSRPETHDSSSESLHSPHEPAMKPVDTDTDTASSCSQEAANQIAPSAELTNHVEPFSEVTSCVPDESSKAYASDDDETSVTCHICGTEEKSSCPMRDKKKSKCSSCLVQSSASGKQGKALDASKSNTPCSADQGSNTPCLSDQESNTPCSSDQGSNKPCLSDQGSNTPCSSDQGSNTPCSSDQESNKPCSSDQGSNTPCSSDQGHLCSNATEKSPPLDNLSHSCSSSGEQKSPLHSREKSRSVCADQKSPPCSSKKPVDPVSCLNGAAESGEIPSRCSDRTTDKRSNVPRKKPVGSEPVVGKCSGGGKGDTGHRHDIGDEKPPNGVCSAAKSGGAGRGATTGRCSQKGGGCGGGSVPPRFQRLPPDAAVSGNCSGCATTPTVNSHQHQNGRGRGRKKNMHQQHKAAVIDWSSLSHGSGGGGGGGGGISLLEQAVAVDDESLRQEVETDEELRLLKSMGWRGEDGLVITAEEKQEYRATRMDVQTRRQELRDKLRDQFQKLAITASGPIGGRM